MQVVDLYEEISAAIAADELALPSLPDIALRIHRAASDPDCTFATIGRVLKRDTAISTQLIRMANGPLYRTRVPVTNVRSAIHRLGVPGVRNFVTTAALRNLFRTTDLKLTQRFRQLWEQSCEISAMTAVLATFCAGFDPDDALLAGLLQDVGAVTLLGQVSRSSDATPDDEMLDRAIEEWAPRVGVLVLTHWGFDQRYIDVARARHDWHFDSGDEKTTIVDVITAARLHFYREKRVPGSWPEFAAIPAYRKLPVRDLSEAGGLLLLCEATEEIEQVRQMLRD